MACPLQRHGTQHAVCECGLACVQSQFGPWAMRAALGVMTQFGCRTRHRPARSTGAPTPAELRCGRQCGEIDNAESLLGRCRSACTAGSGRHRQPDRFLPVEPACIAADVPMRPDPPGGGAFSAGSPALVRSGAGPAAPDRRDPPCRFCATRAQTRPGTVIGHYPKAVAKASLSDKLGHFSGGVTNGLRTSSRAVCSTSEMFRNPVNVSGHICCDASEIVMDQTLSGCFWLTSGCSRSSVRRVFGTGGFRMHARKDR